MLSAIGGNTNSLQMISALNAFKANKSSTELINKPVGDEIQTSSGINLSDNNSLLDKINLSEVRNFAQQVGELNLTDEDIKYGLTYGRSVIANFIA
ncbi:MAG: hypothetical protein ACI4S3_01975 [Candidatus Gastranaerophilaceae bacterium]